MTDGHSGRYGAGMNEWGMAALIWLAAIVLSGFVGLRRGKAWEGAVHGILLGPIGLAYYAIVGSLAA